MSTHASDYMENKALDHVLGVAAYTPAATVYLALFSAFAEGGTQTELSGDGYSRQAIAFDAAGATTARQIANADQETFSFTASKTTSHFAIMDASTGGNVLYYGDLAKTGEEIVIDAGELTVAHNGDLSDYATEAWLDLVLRNTAFASPTPWLALLSSFTNDSTYTEISDANYARQESAFDAASGGATALAADETWPAADAQYTVAYVAAFDASSAGNMLFRGNLDSNKTVEAGAQFRLQPANFDVTLD